MVNTKTFDEIAFRSLFDYATIGMLVVDRDSKILLTNNFALKTFGYTADELFEKSVDVLVPNRFHTSHPKHREEYHHNPQSRPMGAGRDLFAIKKGGEEFPVELSLSHFKKDDEIFVIVFVIDITVRKRSELDLQLQQQEREKISNELNKLNEQLEQKVEDRTVMLRETLKQLENSRDELTAAFEKEKELGDLKSRFVSMASHEFRTPLSTINSSAALLSRYTKEDEQDKRTKHIQRIQEQVKHMNNMLEDLLSLGKLEEGLIDVRASEFNACAWMKELIAEMQENVCDHTLEIVDLGGEMFCTDKKLLRNVLINIVSNAIKFSPPNSVVKITCNVQSDTWSLQIKDNGIGISKEDAQHLFERFFRAKNAANIQGTGLGLHIVARYIALLNGSVKLDSKLNEGTTVCIDLPRLKPFELE
jgi:PAS domain S-box-containing protein